MQSVYRVPLKTNSMLYQLFGSIEESFHNRGHFSSWHRYGVNGRSGDKRGGGHVVLFRDTGLKTVFICMVRWGLYKWYGTPMCVPHFAHNRMKRKTRPTIKCWVCCCTGPRFSKSLFPTTTRHEAGRFYVRRMAPYFYDVMWCVKIRVGIVNKTPNPTTWQQLGLLINTFVFWCMHYILLWNSYTRSCFSDAT